MNKHKFTQIIQNFNNIPDDDRDKLHELAKNYPYSQIIHTLVAKANADSNTDIAGKTLSYAAMYATDRTVLKKIIHNSIHPAGQALNNNATASEVPETENIRNEIWIDLAALKKSKTAYLEWENSQPAATNTEKDPIPSSVEKEGTKKSLKISAQPEKEKPVKNRRKKSAKKNNGTETSFNTPKDWEIIENFICKEPSITSRPLITSENQPDLSEASTAFNEDLISENLALILINQDKKEKAIDIYKKLIWKFPQKKAYFASRIEDLQN